MADSTPTTDVLVSLDGGNTWRTHRDVPGAPASAVKRVRDTNAELAADPSALYRTGGTTRQYKKRMVEAYDLEVLEELPAQAASAAEAGEGA